MWTQRISNIKKWLLDPKNKVMSIAMIGMLIIIIITSFLPKPQISSESQAPESADTYIPDGYVLVPIDIQNIASLSSLIGQFAIVDLFSGIPGNKQQRVGQKLKLLRAPLNPEQFAVLVPENQVSQLLQIPGPYWAVIKNPESSGKAVIQKKSIKKSNIEYYSGEQ